MKRIAYVLAIVLCLAGVSSAQMMEDGPMRDMMGMAPAAMPEAICAELMAACHGDLGQLGLSPQVLESIEDNRFELRKSAIGIVADLQISRLELSRIMRKKGFDPASAKKKAEEITQKQLELISRHLEFLSSLGSKLTEEQWKNLLRPEKPKAMMSGGMSMMDGMQSMMSGSMPMMSGGMPMMQGGMAQAGAPRGQAGQSAAAAKGGQEKEEAGVTVKVAPQGGDRTLVFAVVFDTHTVPLDEYRFEEAVVLRAGGKEYKATLKSQEGSGHHRSAILEFENPKTTPMELVVKGVAGVTERVFTF
ncbi:hypothetical protein EPN96_08875 [bacterium]|nr:MAG: hypothetical protein EPN96_08875 [bacterium]